MWEHTLPSISVCCQIKIKYRLQQLIQNAKKKECLKALIILKCVPGTDWDAVSTVLLNLHRSLIRSKLDYIYTGVSFTVHPVHRISSCLIQSIIKDYDCPFQRSERLQLGVSMLNQTGFGNRRIKLGMQYASKLKAYPSNPAYDCVFNPLYENVYDKQPNTIQPIWTPSKITYWKFWYKFECHGTYCNSWKSSIVKSKPYL